MMAVKPLGSCCCRLLPIASLYKGLFASFLLGCRSDRSDTAAISGNFWSGINLKADLTCINASKKLNLRKTLSIMQRKGMENEPPRRFDKNIPSGLIIIRYKYSVHGINISRHRIIIYSDPLYSGILQGANYLIE